MSTWHVVPKYDIEEHDTGSVSECDCKCGPLVEFLEGGSIMITHNAFDGREIIEDLEAGK